MSRWFKIIEVSGSRVSVNPLVQNIHPFSSFIKEYGKDRQYVLSWFSYLHYRYYPSPDFNPFFYMEEHEKESRILKSLFGSDGVPEPALYFRECEMFVKDMYLLPSVKMYNSLRSAINKVSEYMNSISRVDERNFKQIISILKEYDNINEIYSKTFATMMKEIEQEDNKTRGNLKVAYDQQ